MRLGKFSRSILTQKHRVETIWVLWFATFFLKKTQYILQGDKVLLSDKLFYHYRLLSFNFDVCKNCSFKLSKYQEGDINRASVFYQFFLELESAQF